MTLLLKDPQMEAVTISEAIERHPAKQFGQLTGLVPGSWINANFNVWIGAKEDNTAWDYLSDARDYYDANAHRAAADRTPAGLRGAADRRRQRLELVVRPGTSLGQRSRIRRALPQAPVECLQRPGRACRPTIWRVPSPAAACGRASFRKPPSFIRKVDGYDTLYFDWIGAAMYAADSRTSAMHGRQFFLESAYAGIDEANLYGRLDFIERVPEGEFRLVCGVGAEKSGKTLRLEANIAGGALGSWNLIEEVSGKPAAAGRQAKERVLATQEKPAGIEVALATIFEFMLPLALLQTREGDMVNLRFTLWQQGLPVDALPAEGSIRLQIVPEDVLAGNIYGYSPAD